MTLQDLKCSITTEKKIEMADQLLTELYNDIQEEYKGQAQKNRRDYKRLQSSGLSRQSKSNATRT